MKKQKNGGVAAYHAEIRQIKADKGCSTTQARKIYVKRHEGKDNPAVTAGAKAVPQEYAKMLPAHVTDVAKGNVERLKAHVADLKNQTESATTEQEQWQQLADALASK